MTERYDAKQKERDKFAARLRTALKKAGFKEDSSTELARVYNANNGGPPVTIHACRKWLFAESIPTREKVRVLARALNVREEWLWFGDGPAALDNGLTKEEWRTLTLLRELSEEDQLLAQDFLGMLSMRKKFAMRKAMRQAKSNAKVR